MTWKQCSIESWLGNEYIGVTIDVCLSSYGVHLSYHHKFTTTRAFWIFPCFGFFVASVLLSDEYDCHMLDFLQQLTVTITFDSENFTVM